MLLDGPRKKLLLTGNPGVGKTTLVEFLYHFLKDKNFFPIGFITKEIREKGERKGFVLLDLNSNKTYPLAFKRDPHHRTALPCVGKYSVILENLETLVVKYYEFLENINHIFIIDEIGKMEILSSKFCNFVEKLLMSSHCVIATVGKGEVPFLKKIRTFEASLLCEVTLENRSFLRKRLGLEFFRPGKLIVVEGIDGAGKTVISKGIAEGLKNRGFNVIWSCEPTFDSPYASILREKLKSGTKDQRELKKLFLEDRKWHVANLIIPKLEEGYIVVLDRYYLSTVTYQGSQGFSVKDLLVENETFAPLPDLVLYLDLPIEIALRRINEREEKLSVFEKKEFLEKVSELYQKILPLFNFTKIRAERKLKEVLDEAIKALDHKLKSPFS